MCTKQYISLKQHSIFSEIMTRSIYKLIAQHVKNVLSKTTTTTKIHEFMNSKADEFTATQYSVIKK